MAAAPQKKMNLTQLTFIVAVNMMGSGIIMLPTNMAQVGAISLLSWVVTAVGSMAIAYGFAQAGLFNQRAGGMAAYAEDAYGKSGYFQVFFLYFLSLAIGNVAIAISAVGYLAGFFPWLSSTPIATCIGVIGLLWLTTVANFGGPSVTGKIGSVTVWGVILPVGLLCIIGWFWFSGATFGAAWNPQGLSLGAGMGSSISLTLWAFLGMESAAQNSAAVENPKRDVPLACMFGTLGAAVVYILSTTVIQGIVPNAELADSTGPFALAYAHMFNPTIGSIVMGLAVLACLGSLLGWQFTIAQTGKSAAEERMFPAFFTKTNSMGAPITGMIVLGVVQTLLALSTISPSLSEQFSALVNLAVVTNVIPYVVALSALMIMMKREKVPDNVYIRNTVIATAAMGYSVFALYASGANAVLGGMLVLGIAYIIWGFLAPRFGLSQTAAAATSRAAPASPSSTTPAPAAARTAGPAPAHALIGVAILVGALVAPSPAGAATIDRIKDTGHIRFGFMKDAPPFSVATGTGAPDGYSIALCKKIAEDIKRDLALPGLTVDWVQINADERLTSVSKGKIDLLCAPMSETLGRREHASFSLPIFAGGNRAAVRSDAPAALRTALSEARPQKAIWRGTPAANVLEQTKLAVVAGTTAETWLNARAKTLQVDAHIVRISDYRKALQELNEGKVDVVFGDRVVMLGTLQELDAKTRENTQILDRMFTHEPAGLLLEHGDDDFRTLVDRSLSRSYASGDFAALYSKWCGEFDERARTFFVWNTLQD
jgi:putrescine:ornithine antiporter